MRRRIAGLRLIGPAALIAACQQTVIGSSRLDRSPDGRRDGDAPARLCPAPSGWGLSIARRSKEVRNKILVDRTGSIRWNGSPIDRERLRQYMELVAAMNPVGNVDVDVHPAAPCENVAEIVAMVASAVDCSRHCDYRVAPTGNTPAAPPPPSPRQ
jgi:hypothetical protein